MALVWFLSAAGWAPAPLTGPVGLFNPAGSPPVRPPVAGETLRAGVVLRRSSVRDDLWLLLTPLAVGMRVNGQRVVAGCRLLRDQDELRRPGAAPVFFSTEDLAAVAPFPGAARAAHCPRCRQVIAAGDAAVRCPACRTWHHQTAEYPCWTYSPACADCPQPTAFGHGYRWQPDELPS